MTTGVLVLSHGTPAAREEIAPFYTRIRHGSPPPPALLADLVARYDAIGGLSPLAALSASQARGIADALEADAPGRFVVAAGTKYATPTIEDGIERLVSRDVTSVVGLIVSPLNAPSSTDEYHRRAEAALGGRAGYRAIWSWWDAPGFAALLAERVREVVREADRPPTVLFTAHSLPVRVAGADHYAAQLAALAEATAKLAGLDDHLVCWQSAGRTADEWLGPSLLEVLGTLDPATAPEVVVCPAGFTADHLEVLYDVDVEAARAASARGITLRRTASLNDDPRFVAILARLAEAVAAPA